MQNGREDMFALDLQLSDEEVHLFGLIAAHWGTLEHEVFTQALKSFGSDEGDGAELPKSFNNIQFTETLEVWKNRVLSKFDGEPRAVLDAAYEEVLRLKEPRDALVHGMWRWSPEKPNVITTTRAKKREIISTTFSVEALRDLATSLAKLNFRIRYPGGVADLAAERAENGLHISRKGFEMLFGHPAEASDRDGVPDS